MRFSRYPNLDYNNEWNANLKQKFKCQNNNHENPEVSNTEENVTTDSKLRVVSNRTMIVVHH